MNLEGLEEFQVSLEHKMEMFNRQFGKWLKIWVRDLGLGNFLRIIGTDMKSEAIKERKYVQSDKLQDPEEKTLEVTSLTCVLTMTFCIWQQKQRQQKQNKQMGLRQT